MAKAGFQLPSWGSLSAEQETIVSMPTTKDYVVQGSPGTGKTVMALYRAARISNRDNCYVAILVYNRPLMMYMETVTKTNSNFSKVEVNTWLTWLGGFFKNRFGRALPKISKYEPDWGEVLRYCQKVPNVVPHIIIDEAQDFPIELINCLKIIAKNVTCFIDPNQAIEAGKTDVVDTLKSLFVECPKTLTRNYRNTKPIADLSKLFWNGKGVFAEANAGGVGASKPRMIYCNGFNKLNDVMCDIIRDNREKSIGVLTNSSWLHRTFDCLYDELEGEVELELYKAQANTDGLDFGKKGVKVLSFGTMKGLEFDLVIIVTFEMMLATGDVEADINRAYVAITRACKDLRITYLRTTSGPKWAQVMRRVTANKQLCIWEQ